MGNLLSFFIAEYFSSNISFSSIFKPTLPDIHINLRFPPSCQCVPVSWEVIVSPDHFGCIYTLSNLNSRLLNMIRILTLETIFSKDSLTNLSEKHGLSNSSEGKIQFLCNVNRMSSQTYSTSKLFHHLQHILTDKISSSKDRNYLSLQRTK